MNSYKNYQDSLRILNAAFSWVGNKDLKDSQDHKPYTLTKVTVSAQYCGQKYAGATNYHESPEGFNLALAKVIRSRFQELSEQALAILREDASQALLECESEVKAMQQAIDAAKAELK